MVYLSPGILLLVVCVGVYSSGNTNVSNWKETPCILPKKTINFKAKSQENNGIDTTVWYVPVYQKYELYQTCMMVSGIPVEDLTEDDIEKSCLSLTMEEPGVFTTKGFNGKKMEVVTTPSKNGGLLWKLKGEMEFRGEFWTTLASENYTVTVTCWAKGHRSFSAACRTRTFDSATKNIIVEHATLLGFDPKNFYFYSYDSCDKSI